jgi:hypothetical protein
LAQARAKTLTVQTVGLPWRRFSNVPCRSTHWPPVLESTKGVDC